MPQVDPLFLRTLRSLSALLGHELQFGEGMSASETIALALPGGDRLSVHAADRHTFSLIERDFVAEMLEVMQREMNARQETLSLDQRLRSLERENVDLSMKNRALAEASSRDALTGLFNRWYILEKIEEELNRAWRHGSPMSILMLDIDHFKRVNDSYGHSAGDHVLQTIGSVLRDSCRIYDIPGRYGGEEFCLMLPETKMDNTITVAERIRRRVEATTFHSGSSSMHVTTSIGVAGLESVPDEGLFGAASLIERADRALYVAKDRGRNRIELWDVSLVGKSLTLEH